MNPTASSNRVTQMEAKPVSRAKAKTILTNFGYPVVNFRSGKDLVEGVTADRPAPWFVRQMRGYGVHMIHVEGGYIIQHR